MIVIFVLFSFKTLYLLHYKTQLVNETVKIEHNNRRYYTRCEHVFSVHNNGGTKERENITVKSVFTYNASSSLDRFVSEDVFSLLLPRRQLSRLILVIRHRRWISKNKMKMLESVTAILKNCCVQNLG